MADLIFSNALRLKLRDAGVWLGASVNDNISLGVLTTVQGINGERVADRYAELQLEGTVYRGTNRPPNERYAVFALQPRILITF